MGSWGPGLYQDDAAADLKATITLLATLPISGDEMLKILVDNHPEGVAMKDDGGPAFWLVAADQFERRGIECRKVFAQALRVIDTGADLRDLKAREADSRTLRKREEILAILADCLRSPRPTRTRPNTKTPPPFVVSVGEVLAFPTLDGHAINPYGKSSKPTTLKADGWGALLVLARGRAFDWIPWCAISSLSVDPRREPSLVDAAAARLYSDQGATLCVPREAHKKRMKMQSLGSLQLNSAKAKAAITREYTVRDAAIAGWTFVPQARAWKKGLPGGIPVAKLLAAAS